MELSRNDYIEKLVSKQHNGRAKIITGMRRCGKSYLLFKLYKKYLKTHGVQDDHIIEVVLDEIKNIKYRNPIELNSYITSKIKDTDNYYVFIDEIQYVSDIQNPYVNNPEARINFTDVVLGLIKIDNLDVYITGSNSKMLSTDILTQFRDRGDEIRVFPISYSEFFEVYGQNKRDALSEYCRYGGLPACLTLSTHEEKSNYLKKLFTGTYIKDVIERYSIQNDVIILDDLINILASSVGSLTNPTKLSNTFQSQKHIKISSATIHKYIGYFQDAFLLSKVERYDVKGKKYIQTPCKYYFMDVGLRNSRLGFRQVEENHILENVVYLELLRRGVDVDVGMVEKNIKTSEGKNSKKQLEVDFIVNKGLKRYYIQYTHSIDDSLKKEQELSSLLEIPNSFSKIVVVRDYIQPWRDENGILYIGVEQFLLDESTIDL